MKYASFILAACLSVAVSASALASVPTVREDLTVYVKAVKERIVEVALLNLQQERTSVTIQSLDGKTTYYENFIKNHNGYRQRLNLKDLANGKYLLVVEQGDKKFTQVIVLNARSGMLLSKIVG